MVNIVNPRTWTIHNRILMNRPVKQTCVVMLMPTTTISAPEVKTMSAASGSPWICRVMHSRFNSYVKLLASSSIMQYVNIHLLQQQGWHFQPQRKLHPVQLFSSPCLQRKSLFWWPKQGQRQSHNIYNSIDSTINRFNHMILNIPKLHLSRVPKQAQRPLLETQRPY